MDTLNPDFTSGRSGNGLSYRHTRSTFLMPAIAERSREGSEMLAQSMGTIGVLSLAFSHDPETARSHL
jgi:hypothetical protein